MSRGGPRFAPAWARLGRICQLISLYTGDAPDENFGRAHEVFERALDINHDLSIAHSLYTNHGVELGRAEEAMRRLLPRARQHAGDPELYSGLVQACRYCGLIDSAVAAYERAHRLDPAIRTAIGHCYLSDGKLELALETGQDDLPVRILALELLGRTDEAIDRLRQWEPRRRCSSSPGQS